MFNLKIRGMANVEIALELIGAREVVAGPGFIYVIKVTADELATLKANGF